MLSVSDTGKRRDVVETLGPDFRHRSILHWYPHFDHSDRSDHRFCTFPFYIRIYVCVCVYLLFSLSPKFRFHTIETHDTIPAENAHNVFLLQQGFLLSIVVQKGDVYRIINGYDDCGNVCGRVTPSHPEFQCLDGKNGDNTKNP